jgi:hypothetical protein
LASESTFLPATNREFGSRSASRADSLKKSGEGAKSRD